MKKFVVVAGNIGVGKSTLVDLLSEYLGWQGYLEPVMENPYLADFYQDMQRWGFHSQVHFLTHRFQMHRDVAKFSGSCILDRSMYEDAEIFARNLYQNGSLSQREFDTYYALFTAFADILSPPDLIIYLRASVDTLQKRIQQRDRSYEQSIPSAYLQQLTVLYEQWINNISYCPVLTVPADDLNYVAHPQHLQLIVQKMLERMSGVEEVVFSPSEINNNKH
jgi:deoxyadenosine/deoxycytidine kinase